jgi:biuret amidohydrolase
MPPVPNVIADTVPYPWPWDGDFDPTRVALVVTGVQRSYADASVGVPSVLDRIDVLSGIVRRAGGVVCHVRHSSPRPGRRPLLPQIGHPEWAPVARPGPEDLLVTAGGHDGFCGSSLDLELRSRGLDLVLAVGLAAEVTVSGTVRAANDRGYECLTVADAAAPLSASTGAHELHSVTMSGGIFGAVGDSASVISALRSVRPEHDPVTVPTRAPSLEEP